MDDVIAVVTDLFFQSRIAAAARAAGRSVRFVASEGAVRDLDGYALALVDLEARANVPALIRALKAGASGPLVAFGPHVDAERRKAARAAGADRVLAKSKFVTELPRLVAATSPHGPGGHGSAARDVLPG